MTSEKPDPKCAACSLESRICSNPNGKGPAYCPTINYRDVIEASLPEYEKPDIREFALNASVQEGECYTSMDERNDNPRFPVKPRIQETIEFAHKMGYRKLGFAFCGGLKPEAKIVSDIFLAQGFDLTSVACKIGGTPKEHIGITEAQKIRPGEFEPMCSSIVQAKVLNAAKTEFNILFGLCVGHDSLVMKYSDAMCTALVVKDRVTGHNPLAAINLHNTYYKKLKTEAFGKGGKTQVIVEK